MTPVMHDKNRTCERTDEVLENYKHRAIAAESKLMAIRKIAEVLRTIVDETGDNA